MGGVVKTIASIGALAGGIATGNPALIATGATGTIGGASSMAAGGGGGGRGVDPAARQEQLRRQRISQFQNEASARIQTAEADPFFSIVGPEQQAQDIQSIRERARTQGAARGQIGGRSSSKAGQVIGDYRSQLQQQREDRLNKLRGLRSAPPSEVGAGAPGAGFFNPLFETQTSPVGSAFGKFFSQESGQLMRDIQPGALGMQSNDPNDPLSFALAGNREGR